MPDTRAKLLPIYLAVDVSASMTIGDRMKSVHEIMPRVVDAIAQNPIISDKVRFGLIDFSEDARVQLPLCDVLDPNLVLPELTTRSLTSYVAAFDLLRTEIGANVAQLKADGFQVHRPAVFFLTDGAPTDEPADVHAAFQRLTTSETYPNFVPCGVDQADGQMLQKLIHPAHGPRAMRMYLMDRGQDAAKAITAIAEILIASVLASGQSMAQGNSGMILPAQSRLPVGVSAFTADDEDFV